MLEAWKKVYHISNPEVRLPVRLKCIHGHIPKNVNAIYYKNTPHPRNGQFFLDGDGQVSKYNIKNSQVFYSSRYVQTPHVLIEQHTNIGVYNGAFGSRGILPFIKNVSNTGVVEWNDRLMSFYEAGAPFQLDKKTLHTIGTFNGYSDGLPFTSGDHYIDEIMRKNHVIGDAVGAHPKIYNSRLILVRQQFGRMMDSRVTFFEYDKNNVCVAENGVHLETFNYFHDFAVCESYYIIHQHIFEPIDFGKMWSYGVASSLSSCRVSKESYFVLVDRKTGQSHRVLVPGNFYISHYIQCKEHKNNILEVEFIQYPTYVQLTNTAGIAGGVPRGCLSRLYINTSSMTFIQLQQTNLWIEFPVFDVMMNTIYSCGGYAHPQEGIWAIQQGRVIDEYRPVGCLFAEPFLLGSSGLLGTICYDAREEKSTLQIFNSMALSIGPIAVFEYPTTIVSLGLHGFSA